VLLFRLGLSLILDTLLSCAWSSVLDHGSWRIILAGCVHIMGIGARLARLRIILE
jgi:hypothetical protein